MKNSKLYKPAIIILCTLINLVGKIAAQSCHLPVWLDMTGTCLAAYYTGPIGAVIAGVSCNLLFGIAEPASVVYVITSLAAALVIGFAVRKGWFDTLPKAAMASFWVGVLCLVVSTPLNLLVHEGYCGNMWGDALFDMLDWYGAPRVVCALAGEAVVEIVDKQVCVLLAFGVIYIISGRKKQNKGLSRSLLLALPVISVLLQQGLFGYTVHAKTDEGISDNYVGTIYNNRTGMMSSEANVIEETADGHIWIGSYAGLTRYNGSEFEFIREGGIASVTCMLTDSGGRLWIGTNDGGVYRYEDDKFTCFTMKEGLPANSIRCFAEREDGTVCVGTTDRVCAIDRDDEIQVISADMSYIVSMSVYRGMLFCVSNGGKLFVLDENNQLMAISSETANRYYRCTAVTSMGLAAGTVETDVYLLDSMEQEIGTKERFRVPLNDIVGIEEGRDGSLWLCGEQGFGCLDKDGQFTEMHYENFDTSFAWLHEDYQGNLWVASTRYGVLKLSRSKFADIFDRAGIGDAVVNAIIKYNGDFYCGTDAGLFILDANDYSKKENRLTALLAGDRIRSLMADSQGKLWICTYGDNGLICYDGESWEVYNVQAKQTTSDRFRCTAELSDGTIAAGTADGINFIKDGELTGTLTVQDGLANSQILSLVEGHDGKLYAGSDGAGIYVIENQRIVKNYTAAEGLSSGIILRIVPCEGGYLVVTSNALAFLGDDEEIRVLNDFPYFNNFDVMIDGDKAYVLSSAGIYEVNTGALCGEEALRYRLYGAGEGLYAGLTANSWNYMADGGRLYFCTNSGVTEFYGRQETVDTAYQFGVTSVVCDGERISEEDGVLQAPAKAKRITINASVRNYALTDVKARFYVEGLEDEPGIYDFDRIEPIQLSNFTHGEYKIHMQVLDSMGEEVLSEKTYVLRKEIQLWENTWYKVYLIAVCVESVIFLTWTALSMINASRRKAELERLREELEEKVAAQMKEIQERQKETESLFLQAVTALSDAVDAKDRYTSGHSKRVAIYSRMLAERMGKSEKEQEEIYCAGLLHDVGKIRIPESVINKPEGLSDEEAELIKIHPVTGFHILKGISGNRSIADGARFHHESYDGTGYPNGLKGENIPEIARIIRVADAYDAMASNRSYRKALPQEVVRAEIEKGRGTQFDPEIADIMLAIIDEDREYKWKQEENQLKRILVVDSEPENIREIESILEGETMYTILSAPDGKSALKKLEECGADLVLLDIELSDADGYETLECIQEHYMVPVVFMAADKDIQTIQRAAELGVDDYLTKPFLPMALKEIVHSVLN